MNKKNLIRWSFWPILVFLLFFGYRFFIQKANNSHLELIPSNAKAVVIIDSKKIIKDYYKLLKYNPKELDKVLPESDEEFEIPKQLPGISPLNKVALYVYQDIETNEEQYFKCLIVALNDRDSFRKTMNSFKEDPEKKEYGENRVLHFKKDNKIVILHENTGIVIEPLNPAFEMDLSIGERHYEAVFGESSSLLIDNSKSFFAALNNEKQMNIWVSNGEGILQGMGGDQLGINKIFNSQAITINLEQNSIQTHAMMYLNDKDLIVESESGVAELGENEIVKTSMSLNPKRFQEFFTNLIPAEQMNIVQNWTGKVCASVIGFRKEPVLQVVKKSCINDETFETSFVCDTVELSKNINLPHFITSVEIENPVQIVELLKADTGASFENGFRKFSIPNLIDEYVFVKVQQNNLILSSIPYQFDYVPNYKTFAFSIDIHGMLTKYPPKDIIQEIVLPSLTKFEFKTFEMHFDGMSDDYLTLHGELKMGDENVHTLLQIIPFVYNMIIDF